MEFKGTKGKWSLSLPKTEGVILMNGNVRAQVLSFGNSGINEEDLSNAKLISCAPEMLEFIQSVYLSENTPISYKKQAQYLISKATI